MSFIIKGLKKVMTIPTYKSVYLYLTHACNSNCSFCYRKGLFERNPLSTLGPMHMSKKTADDILDFCFSNLRLEPSFTIEDREVSCIKEIQAVVANKKVSSMRIMYCEFDVKHTAHFDIPNAQLNSKFLFCRYWCWFRVV